jgi:CRP-like cAMP-binding protein
LVKHAGLEHAFWKATAADNAVLIEWLLGLGRRAALERTAHLFCEVNARLELVGLSQEDHFPFPITQTQLGDMLGLSAVHTNRIVQELRAAGLVRWDGENASIPDKAALRKLCEFDPTYLTV